MTNRIISTIVTIIVFCSSVISAQENSISEFRINESGAFASLTNGNVIKLQTQTSDIMSVTLFTLRGKKVGTYETQNQSMYMTFEVPQAVQGVYIAALQSKSSVQLMKIAIY